MPKFKNLFAILLVALTGCFFIADQCLFQKDLAQGDHGRDLYAFAAVLRGEVPYRDFWWVYGPLMPYYYGAFFKIFGIHAASVLLGKCCLTLTAGVLIYVSLSLFIPPLMAYLGALWFWAYNPDFYFTYNHAGGIALLLAATYTLLSYIKKAETKYLFWEIGRAH